MKDRMKAMYYDCQTGEAILVEIVDELDTFYKFIKCDTIDIVVRWFNGRPLNVICDDNGLLKDNPQISAITPQGKLALVGNLLIVGLTDDDGNLCGLTMKDVVAIRSSFAFIKHQGTLRKVLLCRYE